MANPDWLSLDGHTVAVLGAGAEMGPLQALLRWGAQIAAVDLPRPELWEHILQTASTGAGTLLVPARREAATSALEQRAGADLIVDVPAVAGWLADLPGPLVLGNYVYADGGTNVRLSVAVDALTLRLSELRDDVALAFLATPTDVFAVPRDAVEQATRSYEHRSGTAKLLSRPLRTVSGGRLLRRSYVR